VGVREVTVRIDMLGSERVNTYRKKPRRTGEEETRVVESR